MTRSERTSPAQRTFFFIWDAFVSTVQAAAVILLLFIIGITFTNIVRRFVGAPSYIWVEETARVLLAWLTFLGGTLAVARGTHLVLDFFSSRGSRLVQRTMTVVVVTASVAFFGILAVEGWQYSVSQSSSSTPTLGISVIWVFNAAVTGGVLFTFALAGRLVATRLAGPLGTDLDRIDGAATTPAETTD